MSAGMSSSWSSVCRNHPFTMGDRMGDLPYIAFRQDRR
jgi:hypothetical protein